MTNGLSLFSPVDNAKFNILCRIRTLQPLLLLLILLLLLSISEEKDFQTIFGYSLVRDPQPSLAGHPPKTTKFVVRFWKETAIRRQTTKFAIQTIDLLAKKYYLERERETKRSPTCMGLCWNASIVSMQDRRLVGQDERKGRTSAVNEAN